MFFICIHCKVSSQSCLPDGMVFSSQSQIDSFALNYPDCHIIEGPVEIIGHDITNVDGLNVLTSINGPLKIDDTYISGNLSGLGNLTSIGPLVTTNQTVLTIHFNEYLDDLTGLNHIKNLAGNVEILSNTFLDSLSGLDSLTSIAGNLKIDGNVRLMNIESLHRLITVSGDIIITYNGINTILGLRGLTSAQGSLIIGGNRTLESLHGLDNITLIGGSLEIGIPSGTSNTILHDLSGLDNLISIGSDLEITRNPSLKNLTGLSSLITVGKEVSIWSNSSLSTLQGLNRLESIGNSLRFINNDSLIDLSALSSVISIGKNLDIINNPSLTTLDGLENIQPNSIQNLQITNNPLLSDCSIQNICEYLSSPNGKVSVYLNHEGCSNPPEIARECGFMMPCLPFGSYFFSNQSEIDQFNSDYVNCHELNGPVIVQGDHIKNLDGFSEITSIKKELDIWNNDSLISLEGFSNVTSITGILWIKSNAILTSLTGLDNFNTDSIWLLYIQTNPSLILCETNSICEIINKNVATIGIQNNANYCNSFEQVLEKCVTSTEGNISNEDFSVFPNPFSTQIIIQIFDLTPHNYILKISNIWGNEVLKNSITEQNTIIEAASLTPGIYFVCLYNNSEKIVKRIIKF